MSTLTTEPEAVVQQQLDAYNAKDIDAFMRTWWDDAQLFEHPAKLVASGAAEIRARHLARFQEPNLHGHLMSRLAMGQVVIDQERVARTFPEGPGHLEVIVMYEVKGEKIAKAWVITGPKTLDQPTSSR